MRLTRLFAAAFAAIALATLAHAQPQPKVPATVDMGQAADEAKQTAEQAAEAAQEAAAELPEGVVAIVEGEQITQDELERAMAPMLAQAGSNVPPEQQEGFRNYVRQRVLQQMIAQKALVAKAKEAGIAVTDEDVNARKAEFIEQVGGEEQFNQLLTQQMIDPEEVNSEIRNVLFVEKLVEKFEDSLDAPTTEEIQAYYDQNKDKFSEEETVSASHILIGFEEGDDDEVKAEKYKKAGEILNELQEGADFGKLASEHSTCPSAKRGGSLGSFGRNRMVKPFEEVAFSLEPGELSDVVETRFGYHIIKVDEHTDASTPTVDEMKEAIVERLQQPKIQKYLGSITDDAEITMREGIELPNAQQGAVPPRPQRRAPQQGVPQAP